MTTRFNHVIKAGTDSFDDNFFQDADPVGNPTGVYIAFMEVQESADALADYLGTDFVEAEPYSNGSMFGGYGCEGTFVRFIPKAHSVDDVRGFVATLA